ncbi:MAG: 2,3-bisphosphoglycerate-independent phosphoglycerate mutase [Planctomycetales bacterium]|nr:2,3-bisphosphoglycerate-independent phosphoglycerate mutase [Planctomycetales bacterium]
MPRRCHVWVVFDGWGLAPPGPWNAISQAKTPVLDSLRERYPWTTLDASGEAVGLPVGLMGNSEVGHLCLGAGRVIWQDLMRINRAIEDGSFYANEVLRGAAEHALRTGGTLHLLGLASDGGVHSAEHHYLALIELALRTGLPPGRVAVHAVLDGRDTPPKSAADPLRRIAAGCLAAGGVRLATVSGRYWTMDRDKRWDRVESAFRLYALGEGVRAATWHDALESAYARGETDEFVRPTAIAPAGGEPVTLRDGDAVVAWNYRADRMREITRALADPAFEGFARPATPRLHVAGMTRYEEAFPLPVAFPPERHRGIAGDVLAEAGRRQLRVAETEKYAHVTYFFNGGVEAPRPGEERVLVPSSKVATYDLAPEMSAAGVAAKAAEGVASGSYDFVLVNFANADMVGHTGVLPATVRAVEAADRGLGALWDAVRAAGGTLAATADHGNAEQMWDPRAASPHTAHTTNPVPLVVAADEVRGRRLRPGGLADVAPTLLPLMGLSSTAEMTGRSLWE